MLIREKNEVSSKEYINYSISSIHIFHVSFLNLGYVKLFYLAKRITFFSQVFFSVLQSNNKNNLRTDFTVPPSNNHRIINTLHRPTKKVYCTLDETGVFLCIFHR